MTASELHRASFVVKGRAAHRSDLLRVRRLRSVYSGLPSRPPTPMAAAARRALQRGAQ